MSIERGYVRRRRRKQLFAGQNPHLVGYDSVPIFLTSFVLKCLFRHRSTHRLSLWTAPSQRPSIGALSSASNTYSLEIHRVGRIGGDLLLGREGVHR
jgi:hypothetical protein